MTEARVSAFVDFDAEVDFVSAAAVAADAETQQAFAGAPHPRVGADGAAGSPSAVVSAI